MTIREIPKPMLVDMKDNYLRELENQGMLREVLGIDEVTYEVLISVDKIISDEMIFEHYDGLQFIIIDEENTDNKEEN